MHFMKSYFPFSSSLTSDAVESRRARTPARDRAKDAAIPDAPQPSRGRHAASWRTRICSAIRAFAVISVRPCEMPNDPFLSDGRSHPRVPFLDSDEDITAGSLTPPHRLEDHSAVLCRRGGGVWVLCQATLSS
mmetsp:Transcript_20694/g.65071  ORF Transcript_20694/g.65071 Transcript_20694/m.65071 type:complete len:133 (+) Transcript_20694:2531-2929(+)